MKTMTNKAKKFFPFFFAGVVVFIWYAVFYFERHQNLVVNFFDVGQGDAIFIEAPGRNQVLIDGGPSNRILSKLGKEMPFWDRSVDLLVLTHPHADHLDGLLEVLKKYDIGAVLESGASYSTPEYQVWHQTLREKNIPVRIARAGQKFIIGKNTELDILYPLENFAEVSVKNPHDANVVSRLRYGRNSVLLMGDAERSIEYRLVLESADSRAREFFDLESDVLKAGHHGSKTSSSEDFLRAVVPKFSVISVGAKNRYGHPHEEVLNRLTGLGIKILRTDLGGDIKLTSDGNAYKIESEK